MVKRKNILLYTLLLSFVFFFAYIATTNVLLNARADNIISPYEREEELELSVIYEDDVLKLNTTNGSGAYEYQYWLLDKVATDIGGSDVNESKTQYIWQLVRGYGAAYYQEEECEERFPGIFSSSNKEVINIIVRVREIEGNVIDEIYAVYNPWEIGIPVIDSVTVNGRAVFDDYIVVNKGEKLDVKINSRTPELDSYLLLNGDVEIDSNTSGEFSISAAELDFLPAGQHIIEAKIEKGLSTVSKEIKLYVVDGYESMSRPVIDRLEPISQVGSVATFNMYVTYADGNKIKEGDIDKHVYSLVSGKINLSSANLLNIDDIVFVKSGAVGNKVLDYVKFTVNYDKDKLNQYGIYKTVATVSRNTVSGADDEAIMYYDGYATRAVSLSQEAESDGYKDGVYTAGIGITITTPLSDIPDATGNVTFAFYREDASGWTLIRSPKTLAEAPEFIWTPIRSGTYNIQVRIADSDAGSYESEVTKNYIVVKEDGVSLDKEALSLEFFDINNEAVTDTLIAGMPYRVGVIYDDANNEELLYRFTLTTDNLNTVYLNSFNTSPYHIFVPNRADSYTFTARVIHMTSFGYMDITVSRTVQAVIFDTAVNLPEFIYSFEGDFAGLDGYYSNSTLTYAEVTRQAQSLAKFIDGDSSFTQAAFNTAVNALKEGAYNLVITVDIGGLNITKSAQLYILTDGTTMYANSQQPQFNFFTHNDAPAVAWITDDVGGREGVYGVTLSKAGQPGPNFGVFPLNTSYNTTQKNDIKYISVDFYLLAPQHFVVLDGANTTAGNAGLPGSVSNFYAVPGAANAKHYKMYDSITGEDLTAYSTDAAAASNKFLNKWVTLTFAVTSNATAYYGLVPLRKNIANGYEFYLSALRLRYTAATVTYMGQDGEQVLETRQVSGLVDGVHRYAGYFAENITPSSYDGLHVFNEWYADKELTTPFNFTTPIMQDTVLYSSWQMPFALPNQLTYVEGDEANLSNYYSSGSPTLIEIKKGDTLYAKYVADDGTYTMAAFNAAFEALKEGTYSLTMTVVDDGIFEVTDYCTLYVFTEETTVLANSQQMPYNFFKHATENTPVPVWTTDDVGGREGTYGVRVTTAATVNVNVSIFPLITTYSEAQKNAIKYVSLDFYLLAPQVFALMDGSNYVLSASGFTGTILQNYYAQPGNSKHYKMYDSITGEDLSNYNTDAAMANNVFLNRWVTLTFAVTANSAAYYGICPIRLNAGLEYDFYISALRVTTAVATVTYMDYDGEQVLETTQVSGLVGGTHKFAGYLIEEIIPENPDEALVFDGWYTDEELTKAFDFTKAVLGDTVLYSKWIPAA